MTETQAKAIVQQLVTLIDTRIELAVTNPDNSRHYLHLEERGRLEADILADLLMDEGARAAEPGVMKP